MSKSELRKRILNIRNNMIEDDVKGKSMLIMNKLMSLDDYIKSQTVFIYMSFKNEVMTMKLINKMLSENKRVIIPYTDTKNTVLIPSEIKSMDDLVLNSFGYYEPVYEKIKKVEVDQLDLIVTPGIVFDKNLNRVGFGKGYYDRILSQKRKHAKVIAIAYEFQVIDEVPTEPHDVKMDMIITEDNIYR